jgi:hypothetical protein
LLSRAPRDLGNAYHGNFTWNGNDVKYAAMPHDIGATANMNLGGKDFLVQQNWVNANGGSCRLSW